MNIETANMTIPWGEAQEAYVRYRQAVREHRATREDLMLYRGLRALVRGKKVIDINLAIGSGGRDNLGRPKLAIARADWPTVICDGQSSTFRFTSNVSGRRPKGAIDVPVRTFEQAPTGMPHAWTIRCTAQVPLIPPHLRPAGKPASYHVVFEAEWNWQPPVDPLLVKQIDGPFFVVLAVWNLTPLEQAVLRTRR